MSDLSKIAKKSIKSHENIEDGKFSVYQECDDYDLNMFRSLEAYSKWINIDKLNLKGLNEKHISMMADMISRDMMQSLYISAYNSLVDEYNRQNPISLTKLSEYKRTLGEDT